MTRFNLYIEMLFFPKIHRRRKELMYQRKVGRIKRELHKLILKESVEFFVSEYKKQPFLKLLDTGIK
jgi:hypothetical protein